VLIVAQSRFHREALAESLARRPRIAVLGAIGPEGFREGAEGVDADVLVADVGDLDDARRLRDIVAAAAELPVIAIGVPSSEAVVFACVEAGVQGLIMDDASIDDVVANVRNIALADVSATVTVAEVLRRRLRDAERGRDAHARGLTRRESEVLELISAGLSNKAIAALLHLTVPTVKNHVQSILRKLGVHRRTEAARWLRSVSQD
jgi:two-component system response regulator DevR